MPPTYSHAEREWQSRQGLPGSRVTFVKSNKRGRFFGSFCFCKKNQKAAARVATLPTPGTVQNSERGCYLLSRKFCTYREIFMESRGLVPYSSEYFEPVRDGGLTAQGFAGIFEKAGFDLGRQQVMCFRKWESLVGSCV